MKSVKLALGLFLLAALVACQRQSPVAPGGVSGVTPGSDMLAVSHGDDDQSKSTAARNDDASGKNDDTNGRSGEKGAPRIRLSADPDTIQKGQSSTLTWTTSNATSVTLNGAPVAPDGTQVVSPGATTGYTLEAANGHKTRTKTVTVTVSDTPPPPGDPPAATLTAAPATIQAGQSSTLTWTTANATSVTLNGAAVALSGSQAVSPAATTTYALVATGAGGSTTVNATVTVTAPPPSLTYTADIQPILATSCTSCHSGPYPSAGVDLTTYANVMATVTPGSATSPLVRTTQPTGSMYRYLVGSAAQLAETIRSWVVDFGAKQ